MRGERNGQTASVPKPRWRRGSIIDAYEPILKELLGKYPNLTSERALQELHARGFAGGYTTVRHRAARDAQGAGNGTLGAPTCCRCMIS